MRESNAPGISRHRTEAFDRVQEWLLGLDGSVRRLGMSDLSRYKKRSPIVGWRLRVATSSGDQELDLLLDDGFPRTKPRVILVGGSTDKVLPHFDDDGVLCILNSSSSCNVYDPVGVVQYALGEAVALIENSLSGNNEEDFRGEFLSYWALHAGVTSPPVRSLLHPVGPSRSIHVWYGKSFYLVGEDEVSVVRWLAHRFPDEEADAFSVEDALLLWFERAILPAEYPRKPGDLLALAKYAHADQLILEHAGGGPDRVVVVLGFPTSTGPCFAATALVSPSPGGSRGGRQLTAGFRPGRVPAGTLAARYISHGQLRRMKVERVDPTWVHGRGADPRAETLLGKRITVIGCGSVGAPVALALARAGVGSMNFIDPEALVPANLGRHPLGADSLGRNKAHALAGLVRTELPHVRRVDSHDVQWHEAAKLDAAIFESSDLIVSAIGNWTAEGALNEWHVFRGRRQPILYGWTEAHACAGHALAVTSKGGCLQCGFSSTGVPKSPAVSWPEGSQLEHEPACGATFQPYGPVELGFVTAVIAELALDCLLGKVQVSAQRSWIASASRIEEAGGEIGLQWRERASQQRFGFVTEQPWPAKEDCVECGAPAL